MKKYIKKETDAGITVVALTVTVVVLLIISTVTIASLTGDNGLLKKSRETREEKAHGEVLEKMSLEANSFIIKSLNDEFEGDIRDYYKSKGLVNENNEIVLNALIGDNIKTGRGSGYSDIYKLLKGSEIQELPVTAELGKVASIERFNIADVKDDEYYVVYFEKVKTGDALGVKVLGAVTNSNTEQIDFVIAWVYKNSKWSNPYFKDKELENEIFHPNSEWEDWNRENMADNIGR